VVWGKIDIEKPMEFNFVIEWDEPKGQVIGAMKSNAKEMTNLNMSPLTPDKERQLKKIIKNKEQLDKIKPFWGESLIWECMQKILNFDRKVKDMTKTWINDEVVNNYWKNILLSRTRLDANKRMDKSVVGSSAHFFQYLFDEINIDAILLGRYSYGPKGRQLIMPPQ
jgi:hypothetical protein